MDALGYNLFKSCFVTIIKSDARYVEVDYSIGVYLVVDHTF
jgi:hypothetical protein